MSELWSIFDYLMPGFLYSYARFRKAIELPVAAEGDGEAMNRLRCMVHPFIVKLQKSKYQLAEDVLSGEGISSILIDQREVLSLL